MRAFAVIAVAVAACNNSDPLDREEDIAGWANASSAIGAYEWVREPVAFSDRVFSYPDPQCPAVVTTATDAMVSGGCTDSQGHAWTGTAVVKHIGTMRTVTLTDYGNDAFGGSVQATGTVTITEQAAEMHSFDVDIEATGGISTTTHYSGTVAGGYDTPTTWNGSGDVRRTGNFFNGGTVFVQTNDEVRDNAKCAGEGFSGSTDMRSNDHEVVITYDGDVACDPDHSAQWRLDGVDQGILAGVTCSAGGSGTGWVALSLALLLWPARRRSRSRSARG